jgi:hypothetical protein
MTTNTQTPTDEPSTTLNSKWWCWIAAQPIAAICLILAANLNLGTLFSVSLVSVVLTYFISLVAYAADVKAIATTDSINWQPSRLVYLPLAIVFGAFTAVFYLYKRHKHVGVP